MLETVWRNPWVRAALLVAALAGLVLLVYLLNFVLVPLMVAFLAAYIFNPLVNRAESRKIPRMAAILGILAVLGILALSLPLIMLPHVIQEAKGFANAGVKGAVDANGKISSFEEHWLRALVEVLGWEPAPVSLEAGPANADTAAPALDYNPREVLLSNIANIVNINGEQIREVIRRNAGMMFGIGQKGLDSVTEFVKTLVREAAQLAQFTGSLVLFIFVTIYLLRDYNGIIESIKSFIPPRNRDYVCKIFGSIDTQLKAFFRGQLMVCACLGTMYAIGLSLSGVPFAVPLAVFGGFASFVPFLGLALTIGPAVFLTLLYHGLDGHVAGVLATFIIAQALEGNFLTPKIVGSQVGLGPVWVILAIMVFGTTLGFRGLLVAVPLAAVLKVLVLEGVAYYRGSEFFAAPAGPGSPDS